CLYLLKLHEECFKIIEKKNWIEGNFYSNAPKGLTQLLCFCIKHYNNSNEEIKKNIMQICCSIFKNIEEMDCIIINKKIQNNNNIDINKCFSIFLLKYLICNGNSQFAILRNEGNQFNNSSIVKDSIIYRLLFNKTSHVINNNE